jgi:hypothetical protein
MRIDGLRAVEYVSKPIDFGQLMLAINAQLVSAERSKLNRREVQALTWAARGATSAERAISGGWRRASLYSLIQESKSACSSSIERLGFKRALRNQPFTRKIYRMWMTFCLRYGFPSSSGCLAAEALVPLDGFD